MKPETADFYRQRVMAVQLHIQRHLDDEASLDELAKVARFSPFHFHRIFRALTGESVMACVRRLRLERSVMRLRSTDAPILQIALEAGYEAHQTFTRAFGERFGESPSAYRRRAQEGRAEMRALARPGDDRETEDSRTPRESQIMEMRIETREPCRVAFVRHTGPYVECGKAWGALCGWAGPKGLLGPGTPFVGLSYDDPEVTPPEKLRYDACIPVGDDVEASGSVAVQTIEGGTYAIATHRGAYSKLIDTYRAIYGQWLPASGYVCRDAPPIEIYRNSPDQTPEEDLLTDICIPVSKTR